MSSQTNQFVYQTEVILISDAPGFYTTPAIAIPRARSTKIFPTRLGVDDFNAERDEDIYVVVHSLNTRYRQPLSQPGDWIRYSLQRIRSGG